LALSSKVVQFSWFNIFVTLAVLLELLCSSGGIGSIVYLIDVLDHKRLLEIFTPKGTVGLLDN